MQILALNASPRKTKGSTHRILNPFLEGAAEAGAIVETLMVRDLKVKPCLACLACWLRTPETCVQDDDMTEVLARARAADVWVLATPVYVDGMVGALKVVLDRMLPLIHPEMELREGHMRHPATDGVASKRMLLISVCGFYELENFDPLVAHVRAISRNLNAEYVGAMLRPHAPGMEALERFGSPPTQVFDACRQAGRQLVTDWRIDPALLDQVSRPLMPIEMYLQGFNDTMQRVKAKHQNA